VGVSLRQRLRTASSRQVKLAALAVLVIYAVVMLWPYLAATLVRGSAVTAWTNVATAPIPGRTALPAGFHLQGFRSRGTGHAFVLEVALACAPGTDVAAAQQAERSLAAGLADLLPETQLSLIVQAMPANPRQA
jgi:hypothetical protein